MIKIEEAFKNKKAFIPFVLAGYPNLKATEKFIIKMAEAGADLIEIGIPFSDPVAEGTVIQAATNIVLNNEITTNDIFDMVENLKEKVNIPLVFMTYINPIFVYGKDRFFAKCKQCNISGVIVADLPFEEKDEILTQANKYDVEVISLIAPTSENRIGMIATKAQGFIYCVSSLGVTGVRKEIKTDIRSIVDTIRKYTDKPVAVGFGISTPEQAKRIGSIADGVIVGSAIIKIIDRYGENADEALQIYVKEMKNSMN